MRVLVTGGAGYIGSCTAARLAAADFEPIVFDNLSTGHQHNVRWGPLVTGDLADGAALRDTLHRHKIEVVIHFAASAYIGASMRDPRGYFQNNVTGSLSLLDALLDAGVRRIIFSSSCATYGIPEAIPIAEEHPQRPVNPYGESKLFVERALRWYGEAYGLHWTALRYFNVAGADLEYNLGESHDPEMHLIPLVIDAALGRRPQIELFGSGHPTPDGTAVRDYIHVADLADAHVLALRYLIEGGDSRALNLGTGRGYSVREVVDAVARVGGREITVAKAPRRPGDPSVLVADPAAATRILGWQPRYRDIDAIIDTAWSWGVA